MKINVTRQDGMVEVAIVGRIDNFTSAHFEQDLNILIKTGVKKIVLDFTETNHLGVLTIHFLKKTIIEFMENGGRMSMRCPNSKICSRIHSFISCDEIPLEQCELV
ncbi:MAG: STAS domain-containing protein [Bacteriovoracaceae bacterium]|nr:STAS domain-containing protein [Bacteriovoracaceae bacterium]